MHLPNSKHMTIFILDPAIICGYQSQKTDWAILTTEQKEKYSSNKCIDASHYTYHYQGVFIN